MQKAVAARAVETAFTPGRLDEDGRLTPEARRDRALAAAASIKEFLLDAPQAIDTQRLEVLLDTYEKFGHEPTIVLRARVFERLIESKTLFLDENPLVGAVTGKRAGVYVYPEWDAEWILSEIDEEMLSHLGRVDVSAADKALMREAALYFRDRSATAKAHELSRELNGYDPTDGIAAGLVTESHVGYTIGAGNVDYDTFVARGLKDIVAETEARLHALPVVVENAAKIDFYRAALITLRAVVRLAHRYAELAEDLAETEADPERRAELAEIAEVCRHVPENPPRSFREAVQSWWFLHLGIQIEQSGCGSSPGRLGQYLDRYYQADKAEGQTSEDAVAWLKCLFVKILEYGYYQGISFAQRVSGHTGHTINVGGFDADGGDATTELDYLILDTQIDLKNIQPSITLLYHDRLKEDFLFKAIELDRTGLGQPQWMNASVVVQRLLARHARNGVTLADARNSINMSCVSTGIAGKTAFLGEAGGFNLAKCIELALHDGRDPLTGKPVGARTGDPAGFSDFEQVFAAYSAQVRRVFELNRPYGSISNKVLGDTVPSPYRSALYGGCLERGAHEFAGGPDYYLYFTVSTAGVDAANSLAAIRHLVFETRQVDLPTLVAALDADFEGYEEIRALCRNAPKHGNGDPAIDALTRRVYDDAYASYHASGSSFYGEHIANLEAYSLSVHNYFGQYTGALPTGRKKGTPLTDASVSAAPGTDRNGPLALIGSAARAIDTVKYGSNHFNMKFHPSALNGAAGARSLLSLIKSYMDQGGSHIQFNVVSSDTLRKAQAAPEEYKGLTVRVAGFSAYFTRLHKGVQDEIIARTELAI